MKLLIINAPNIDLSYFSKRGLTFEVEHKTITQKFPLKFLYYITNQSGQSVPLYTPDVHNYLEANFKEKYAGIIVGYSASDYGSELNNTGGYAYHTPLSSGAFWATVRDGNSVYAIHELHHILCNIINLRLGDKVPKDFMDWTLINGEWKPYWKNETPEDPDSNHGRTWANIVPFLPRMEALFPTGYRYFKGYELYKMTKDLMDFADELRHRCGFPLAEVSGFRTPEQNRKVGGVFNSPHLDGKAKDWRIPDGARKYKFVEEAQKLAKEKGVVIGIGIGDTFCHLDVNHRQVNTVWNYK
jgi:uncharacterized protein YcbK (DUF882 family)